MSRNLTRTLTLLFASSCFVAMATEEPCAKCQKTCCDIKSTARDRDNDSSRTLSHVELQLLIAEIEPAAINQLSLAETESHDTAVSFHEMAESLMKTRRWTSPDRSFDMGTTVHGDALCEIVYALKERGLAKILAQPRMVTCSGRAGSMVVGGETPFLIPSQNGAVVEFREWGHRIDWSPTVIGHDTIHLDMSYENSSLDFAHGSFVQGTAIPGIVQRRLHTMAELRSGESMVLGRFESPVDAAPALGLTVFMPWWNESMTLCTCVEGSLAPCSLANAMLSAAVNSLMHSRQETKELVIVATANLCDPFQSHQGPIEESFKLSAAAEEADSQEPHRPAILLTPAESAPIPDSTGQRPHARLDSIPTIALHPSQSVVGGADSRDAGLAGKIICSETVNACRTWQQLCCDDPEVTCQQGIASCCRNGCSLGKADSDEDEDDDEEDEDDDDSCCDREIESFIAQVLQAQMQYLDSMMRARLEHERQMLQAKANAESALAKQQVEHAQEILKIRTEHLAELHEMKEALWTAKYEAMEARYIEALDHQRDLFALKQRTGEELQSERIASLQAEIRALRNHVEPAQSDRVAHTPDGVHQSSSIRRPVPIEMPVQVEDLASGRVRYAPVPPKPENVVLYQPHDAVERIEFSTPPISTGQTMLQELECLRRELGRLRVIVEDMLCFTPDFPPNPVPQVPMGDCDN
jgi:hypothetical protein